MIRANCFSTKAILIQRNLAVAEFRFCSGGLIPVLNGNFPALSLPEDERLQIAVNDHSNYIFLVFLFD